VRVCVCVCHVVICRCSVADCVFVTSESGPFSYVSRSDDDVVCGIYFLTDPDRIVEIHVHSFDVPCEHRGLLAVCNHH